MSQSHNNSSLARKRLSADISVVEDGTRRKSKDGSAAGGKENPEGRPAAKKNPDRPVKKKKVIQEETEYGIREVKPVDKPSAKKRPRPEDEEQEAFERRMKRRDEERARRKQERLKKVRRQKIIMAVSAAVIVTAAAAGAVFCLPSVRFMHSLAQGDRYFAKADYANAQTAYEKALEIDATSVEAYRCMAGNYIKQNKTLEAEETFYTGWEKTQDAGLLHSYCVLRYNEAVEEINADNCTLATVDKCIQVLEQEPENAEALELMGTCYERLFGVSDETDASRMFFDEDASQDTCGYAEYEGLVRRLMALYQTKPSTELKDIIAQYALIDMPYVHISLSHVEQYMELLTEINSVAGSEAVKETLACLSRAKEVGAYFDKAFTEFTAGNYAYARELVAEESYQKIRDSFIEENSGCWEGSVYIPVNRELLVLHNEDGRVRFFFPDGETYNNRQGIIKVWGTKQEDDGVQRSVISYEPAQEDGSGSDTEYTVQYLYSNVKIGGEYVPQMNYRFDTKVTTEDGITTKAIGDWGGEHEWEIDY